MGSLRIIAVAEKLFQVSPTALGVNMNVMLKSVGEKGEDGRAKELGTRQKRTNSGVFWSQFKWQVACSTACVASASMRDQCYQQSLASFLL